MSDDIILEEPGEVTNVGTIIEGSSQGTAINQKEVSIDREEGEEPIKMLISGEVPEECLECQFYIKNVNQDSINNDDPRYYCFLKAKLVSAQYGGIDVADPDEFKCPCLPIKESDEYIELDERVSELEEKVARLEECCEAVQATIGTLQGSISSLSGQVSALSDRISALEPQPETPEDPEEPSEEPETDDSIE